MLPTATRPAHAARTGCSLLRPRAADGDDFGGICGALRRRAIRAVSVRVRVVRRGRLFVARRGSLRGQRREV